MQYSSAMRRSTSPAIGDWLDWWISKNCRRPCDQQKARVTAPIIRDGVLFAGQPFEAAPAVDLQHAGVVGQHLPGTIPDPVLGVDIGHRRRQVAPPGGCRPGRGPRDSRSGPCRVPAPAGACHRRTISVNSACRRAAAPTAAGATTPSGPSSPTGWRSMAGRTPGSGPDGTAAGRHCTSRTPPPGPADLRSAGRRGWRCPAPTLNTASAQPGSRRSDACTRTRRRSGTASRRSVSSTPIGCSAPLQHGQIASAGSITTIAFEMGRQVAEVAPGRSPPGAPVPVAVRSVLPRALAAAISCSRFSRVSWNCSGRGVRTCAASPRRQGCRSPAPAAGARHQPPRRRP